MHPKLKLLWLQGVTCNGSTHSFLNHPSLAALLEPFEILHHPLLPCTYSLERVALCSLVCDVLVFEGVYDPDFTRAGETIQKLFAHYAKSAKHIIAAGTCASFGGLLLETAGANASGLAFCREKAAGPMRDGGVINLPGCPLHPEWLGFVLQMIVARRPLLLDAQYRPQELYAYMVHHGCMRNEYFEWKVDTKQFGQKEGCLFYDHGCRGPMSHGPCNKILWNASASKTRSGQPCIGCTEADFPLGGFFTTQKNMSIPRDVPLGVPKRSYLTLAGIAKTFTIPRLEKRLIDDNAPTD